MKSAPNIALVGPMGAGKSSVAALLAPLLGLQDMDADAEVERDARMAVAAIFERYGEPAFRRLEQQALGRLLADSGRVVATGGGAVLDPDTRALLGDRAFVVHLHVTPAEQLARLRGDASRPLLQAVNPAAQLRQLATERDPLYASVADLRIVTERLSPQQVARKVREGLDGRWQRGEAA